MTAASRVVALSGGIGGAKLAFGLSQVLGDGDLSVIANTGDDFIHVGLHISPDIDTLLYTLAGVNNPDTGWGRANETWSFMSALKEVGAPTWFQLGDKDLALNVYRSNELRAGKSLSDIVSVVAQQFGLQSQIIPMSDDPVHTMIDTDSETLAFQDYFVRQECKPVARRIHYEGIERARPSPGLHALLRSPEVEAYIICPSNPYLSIDPILALPGVREGIRESAAPVVVVSPVIAGKSLKGPTSKIMGELGIPCSSTEVAAHYQGLIDGIVVDDRDAGLTAEIEKTGVHVVTANILMNDARDKTDLATTVLSFVRQLASKNK